MSRLLTDVGGKDTKKAIADLEKAKLSSLFSYRQAYFVGAQAQRDLSDREKDAEEMEFLDSMLHMPFFDFCLRVKERKQQLESKYLKQEGNSGNPT